MKDYKLKDLKIVEYEPGYAESLAEMWNLSSDNWGGSDSLLTAEEIKDELANSANLNTYLAVKQDGTVVGYCGFSEYREDEGALYIPLLNVRPDYQGKKIGKALVLQAVKRTVELGWPRVDLYTWPGNTKAVPLYKKCGFFWEDRDDTTHLMNFIPSVLNTDAVKDYFDYFDWYEDSIRSIEIKPDGKIVDNNTYYQYRWEKADRHLTMEYERRGRGLRLLETDQYLIKVRLDSQELIFGRDYKVYYEIINKSGDKLDISISGVDNKNVKFAFNRDLHVEGKELIEASFFVEEIEEEFNDFRTHPVVKSIIKINGREAVFSHGFVPRFPVKINLQVPVGEKYWNSQGECYLEMVNGFTQEAVFNFNLPSNKDVSFNQDSFSVKMKPKEKKMLVIPYQLSNSCFYQSTLNVRAHSAETDLTFKKKITGLFKGRYDKFWGETDDEWLVSNGKHLMTLTKFDNHLAVNNFKSEEFKTYQLFPKLGRPFSMEFSRIRPQSVNFFKEDVVIGFKATYLSRDFENIQLILVASLFPDGLVEIYYEVENLGDEQLKDELRLSQTFYHNLTDLIIPYQERVIRVSGSETLDLDSWDSNLVSENWFFSQNSELTRGIIWPDEGQFRFNGWLLAVDYQLGRIKGKEKKRTGSSYLAWDVFNDWKELRTFFSKNNNQEQLRETDKFELIVNGGNPFVSEEFSVSIRENRKKRLNGTITLSSKKNAFLPQSKELEIGGLQRQSSFLLKNKHNTDLDVLKLNVDLDSTSFQRETAYFYTVSSQNVQEFLVEEKGSKVFTLDNGLIKLKASPDFAGNIYSLQYGQNEWLDSSFPVPEAKSWWKPWIGGISTRPDTRSTSLLVDEQTGIDYIDFYDNYDNYWKGLTLNTKIINHEKFKGLQIKQHFLLLPDSPVIACQIEVLQNTGTYFNQKLFKTEMFIKQAEDVKDRWFLCQQDNGEFIKYKAGRSEYDIYSTAPLLFGGEKRTEKMLIFSPHTVNQVGVTNNQLNAVFINQKISAVDGSRILTQPFFLIFTEEYLEERLLKQLSNISFKL